jgi:ketosteroid isomerase-like protein
MAVIAKNMARCQMMRSVCLAALIILSLAHKGDALVAGGQTGGVTSELTQIEQRLVKSWVDGDRAAVEAILAHDWSVIDMTGHVLTKQKVMKEFGSGDRRIESGSIDDLKVRAFGEIAVVTGRSELTGSYRGTRAIVVQRFTDVFAKREGRWQAVASQGTQIAQ